MLEGFLPNLLLILFCLSSLWIAYVFVIYPAGMLLLARIRPRRLTTGREEYQPTVAFVMAAYNEEKVIAGRLENYRELDYPRALLSFHLGSDASTDATDQIVERFATEDQSIRLRRFNRSGKTQIVYELAEETDAEIIVFTDADILLEPEGVQHIVAPFADPTVGGVIGRMVYTDLDTNAGNQGQRKYLEIENELRHAESLVWTTVGPRGECFAVRRGAYRPLTDYRLSDDLNLVITIPLNGFRVWYEPSVVIRETSRRSLSTEFHRRLRMGQQAAATLVAFPETRYPWRSWIGFQIWSHKLLRILAAIPLVVASATAIPLAFHHDLFIVVAVGVAIWCGIMGLGILTERLQLRVRLLQYPLYFTSMIVSLTIGSLRGVMRGGLEKWSSQRVD
jgi:cellulose synthase/poly-beta-1,6-N-acetylglucosamine synthase-like glycosyltransferase